MTANPHDPSLDPNEARLDSADAGRVGATLELPRWLLPAAGASLLGVGLVVAGVMSLSTALYVGLFGGMLLMHLGGHGHGGHGGHGGAGHQGTPGGALGGDQGANHRDLSGRSDDSQPGRSALGHELDDRAAKENRDGTGDHDRPTARGCH